MFGRVPKRDLKIIKQENGAIIFDKKQGIYFQTNDIGVEILKLLSENKSEIEIVKELANKYSIEYSIVEDDVKDFINSLNRGGV